MTDYELQMTRIKKLEVQPGIEIGYEELGTGDKYVEQRLRPVVSRNGGLRPRLVRRLGGRRHKLC